MAKQTVTYDASNGTLQSGTSTLSTWGDCATTFHNCQTLWVDPYPYYPRPTVTYIQTPVYQESKFDRAFKVAEMLMAKGHVKELPVKDFITLVKEIAASL